MGQYAVIGLGIFGFNVAKTLYENGHEVIAIDNNNAVVQKIKDYVTDAVLADVTDKENLNAMGISNVDAAIVNLGEQIDSSILVTLYLKELGVQQIIVKAVSEDHGKILSKVGATEIIHPEKDIAIRLARKMGQSNILDYLPLSPGYSIFEIEPPDVFCNKTIGELQLRTKYDIQIVALRDVFTQTVNLIPGASYVLKKSDIMIIIGKDADLEKIKKLQ